MSMPISSEGRSLKKLLCMGVILTVLTVTTAWGQSRTGMPLDLDYFMSREQVLTHLKLLDTYRVESGKTNSLAYVVPSPDTNTKNGLFLEFSDDKLIEIASMKMGMNKALFEKYVADLISLSEKWKADGVETVIEEKSYCYYLYRDRKSYIEINGDATAGRDGKFSVTLTFTERLFRDGKRPMSH
jgi:hypothetical protein